MRLLPDLSSSILFSFFHLTLTSGLCPPDGPLLPRPTSLEASTLINTVGANLTSLIDATITYNLSSNWFIPNVSFSLALVSSSSLSPLWTYNHLASANVNGSKHVDGNSQFLVGSVSKVFTDLLLLKSNLSMDDPVTKYLPELEGDSEIAWGDVSLEALGNHLSGMPPTFGFPEIFFLVPYFEKLGFPKLREEDFPECGVIGLNGGCSKQQLLSNLKKVHPTASPNLHPEYSSVAFTLISYALEASTGMNYSTLLRSQITQPLNLTNTFPSPGTDGKAVIPPGDSSWGSNYGDNVPGGGLVSSSNDLSILLHAILSHSSSLLPPGQVSKWLKPTSVTSDPNMLVGLPWEILRTNNLTPKYSHNIDLYTKSGAAVGYAAQIGVVDQYGIGFVVLTAGAKGVEAQVSLFEAMASIFVEAVEEEAREQAETNYVGTYTESENRDQASGDEGTVSTTFMTLDIDSGPGLILANLTRNGTDMLGAIRMLWDAQMVAQGSLGQTLRMYPTDVVRIVDGMVEVDWRIQYDPIFKEADGDLPSQKTMKNICVSWQTGGALAYGGEPVERFVFVQKKEGKVIEVRWPAGRVVLVRKDK